jgi:ABC-type uncharacterized transport system substrate-binding protein
MRRRAFLTGVALLLGSPVPSRGQSAKKIGGLNPASHETAASSLAVFREELKELGHIEGRHYTLEQRDAGGGTERLPGLAGELAALPVDMIVAPGTSTALAAMQATRVIPIVIVTVADPVGSGLVRSFARPEGNVTGTALALDEISRKWLELLRALRGRLTRVAVVQTSTNRSMRTMLGPLETSARALGMTLSVHDVTRTDAVPAAFTAVAAQRAEAIVVLPDPFLQENRARVVEQLRRVKLPSMFASRGDVVAGGLVSYGPDFIDSFRRAAAYVDKILKGAKPADLPVERSRKFELVINRKTANALGLTRAAHTADPGRSGHRLGVAGGVTTSWYRPSA